MNLNAPLNKTQLEILKLFSRDLDDVDLLEIKMLITKYLSEKSNKMANQVWDKKGWTNKDMDELSRTHLRTPYNKN